MKGQEKIKDLPKDPDKILTEIRNSEEPRSEAFAYGRALLKLTKPEKKDFWYKSELNLLSLILLYVSKANSFVPTMVATGNLSADMSCTADEQRNASEVIDCMEDPVTFRLVLQKILQEAGEEDSKLLRYGFNAYMTSKVRDNVASSLAVESEIIEYLTYGR